MYVCMYVCIYVCIYKYIYIHTYVCIYEDLTESQLGRHHLSSATCPAAGTLRGDGYSYDYY